jgi:hypothetical protein
MAEFAIMRYDKPLHNARLQGEHEIVSACRDGWGWSELELASRQYRMIKVPGMTEEEAQQWVVPEMVNPETHVRRRRHFKLDPSKMPKDFLKWYNDDQRSVPIMMVERKVFEKMFRDRVPMKRREEEPHKP